MRTFFEQTSGDRRHGRRSLRALLVAPAHALGDRLAPARRGGEDGFLLIEVMISVLLVGLIVVGTFNGFEVASRLTADQRHHSEAALLAAESQEQLRSDSATALDVLESHPHVYTREIASTNGGKEIYTITQEAKAVSANNKTGCTVGTNSKENGANIEITSAVTWAQLLAANRPPVKQSSLITPPVGSGLEVDVSDGGTTPQSGVTAVAKFKPVGSSSLASVEGTTGSAGCVVLSGLASTSATVEILEKPGFVTTGGDLKYPTKEITIAPNITTQYPVTYAAGGALRAQFTYNGATTYSGKPVTGDTFVAFNAKIPAGDPPYQVGSTSMECQSTGEQEYKALTGTYTNETATTATCPKYVAGDLFPFPTSEWVLYAGDCPKNAIGAESEAKSLVAPGATTRVSVPTSFVQLNVKSGNYANRATSTTEATSYEVTTSSPECESYEKPNNAFGTTLTHFQHTNSEGLEAPFQPFGKQALCLYNKAAGKTYRTSYTNATAAGTTKTLYIGQASKAEREAEEAKAKEPREKLEAEATAAKTKREKEEKEATEAKTKRGEQETAAKKAKEAREKAETEQTTARTAREKKEKEEREKWAKEVTEKKLTEAKRKEKETAQTKVREEAEKAEKTAKEKRTTEETEAANAKTQRGEEETAATKAKEKRVEEETAATKAKEKRVEEEAKYVGKEKEERVKAEETAEKETGFAVASKQSSC